MMTMVISGSDGVTFPDSTNQFSGGAFSFKNRIINGDMRIAQRGTAAVTVNGAYPVDRFFIGISTDGAYSAQQDSSAPAGFVNSTKLTTTTADASLGATQYWIFRHKIEGTNIADFGWGTANAKTITVSFWVRSSLTGTFGGAIGNSAGDRSYVFTYSISVADTWEYKTVTIAGDTTGTWLTTNGTGLEIYFGLGVGSTYSGTAGSWSGNFYLSETGATSVIGTLNATWYITGVQLEVGSVATPFERRPYGTELALCQRYYLRIQPTNQYSVFCNGWNDGTSASRGVIHFQTTMRTRPTALEQTGTASDYYLNASSGAGACTSVPTFDTSSTSQASVQFNKTSLTTGQATLFQTNVANAYLGWSAEL